MAERHDAPCFGRFIFLISLHCGSVFGMSEQARKAYFRVAVKHPGKTRLFYVVMDLNNLEGETLRYPKMRAAKAIKLLFKVDVPQSEFREGSEAEMSKMKLKALASCRYDMALYEIG